MRNEREEERERVSRGKEEGEGVESRLRSNEGTEMRRAERVVKRKIKRESRESRDELKEYRERSRARMDLQELIIFNFLHESSLKQSFKYVTLSPFSAPFSCVAHRIIFSSPAMLIDFSLVLSHYAFRT